MAIPLSGIYFLLHGLILWQFDVLNIVRKKDLIQEEILKRYTYTDESCRDTLLGNTLRFYEFPEEQIESMNKIVIDRFSKIHD